MVRVTKFRSVLKSGAFWPVFALEILAGVAFSPSAIAAAPCTLEALSTLNIRDVTITAATDIPKTERTPGYCQVTGSLTTNGEGAGPNHAGFRIDLPISWNGKFLFLGGTGLDGSVQDGRPEQIAKGYATASTDAGHTGTDGSFAVTAPGVPDKPKVTDYYYRAVHQAGLAAKKLVIAFYNAPSITRAYFIGCSGGGKEGLTEAIRYPDDYDGIISGDPPIDMVGVLLGTEKNIRAFLHNYIPPEKIAQINAAVLAQCDSVDGVQDGLIQDPARCAFDPDSLVPTVLTQGQANALKITMSPVKDSTGKAIFPGVPVSDPLMPFGGKVPNLEGTSPAPYPTAAQPWGAAPSSVMGGGGAPFGWGFIFNFINYLGMRQPDNNLNSDDFEKSGVFPAAVVETMYRNMNPYLVNDVAAVARYLAKGKKLILYVGYSDPYASPFRTAAFYSKLAERRGGYTLLQKDARLFLVPDMGHCLGGTGPDVFGNTPNPPNYPTDAQHDLLSALAEWVEEDKAPGSIIATHYVGDDAKSGKIDRTMPLCPFPTQAQYSGRGEVNDEVNWSCKPNDVLLSSGVNGKQAAMDASY